MHHLVKAHEKVKGLNWEPSYIQPAPRHATKFKIPKKARDPFRHLIRDYVKMEKEKDDRQYGFLDGNIRIDNPNQAEERFVEGQKLFLALFTMPEYTAMKCQGMLVQAVDNQELRQGYLAQMLDEARHCQQLMYLNRYFMRNYRDPAGFDNNAVYAGKSFIGTAARAAAETFVAGDPIECSIMLQVAGETGFTNPIFVGFPQVAAAQGEYAVPTVFLSIQSDESRHMANGFATLSAALSEPDNLQLVQDALEKGYWRIHRFVDPALAYLVEYTTKKRPFAYKDMWQQWLVEEWFGAYIAKLSKFGVKAPTSLDEGLRTVQWASHSTAMLLAAAWPFLWWRQDPMVEEDFEWFEKNYTGWYGHYGKFWEEYRRMSDPREGMLPLAMMHENLPPICQVCLLPGVYPRPDITTARVRKLDSGRKVSFCGDACQRLYDAEPLRYEGHTNWFTKYAGWDIAEVIREHGLIRPDGKTLVGQPSLDTKKMWTIDDIEKLGMHIHDPLAD